MKTEIVRDIPLGVLLVVLAQFFFYGVLYFSKFPSILEFLGIVLFVLCADRLTRVGIRAIFGMEVEVEDDDKE